MSHVRKWTRIRARSFRVGMARQAGLPVGRYIPETQTARERRLDKIERGQM